jgi:hypothetical protein
MNRRVRTASLALPLLAVALFSGGCYEKTVSAKGFGADRVTLSAPDSPDPVKTTKLRQSTTHKNLPAQRMRVQER